ncbi:uncharacterized protein UTRI_02748 [Ustilago trichophora]|uniref:Uncharacterized protein n=1 Tax=Ustilago trichophora TaxID=86804 RepID=A0A5C3ES19_9BASI|nr:uncharacterized protein UTRI_02748 [Ustilago trichophora]
MTALSLSFARPAPAPCVRCCASKEMVFSDGVLKPKRQTHRERLSTEPNIDPEPDPDPDPCPRVCPLFAITPETEKERTIERLEPTASLACRSTALSTYTHTHTHAAQKLDGAIPRTFRSRRRPIISRAASLHLTLDARIALRNTPTSSAISFSAEINPPKAHLSNRGI